MLDERCKDTVFLIKATDTERFFLWRENVMWKTLHPQLYLQWEEDSRGKVFTIGQLYGKPINISVVWSKLDGKRVCFYTDCSNIVDHQMIEAFMKEYFPAAYDKDKRWQQTNSMNFHICRDHIKKLR